MPEREGSLEPKKASGCSGCVLPCLVLSLMLTSLILGFYACRARKILGADFPSVVVEFDLFWKKPNAESIRSLCELFAGRLPKRCRPTAILYWNYDSTGAAVLGSCARDNDVLAWLRDLVAQNKGCSFEVRRSGTVAVVRCTKAQPSLFLPREKREVVSDGIYLYDPEEGEIVWVFFRYQEGIPYLMKTGRSSEEQRTLERIVTWWFLGEYAEGELDRQKLPLGERLRGYECNEDTARATHR